MADAHTIRFDSQTHVGMKRSHNQDACVAQPAADARVFRAVGHVFVVADGMGGHAVGEKASAKAARDIPLTYTKHVGTDGAAEAIRRAFTEANAGIFQIGQNTPEFKGLGTTGTALFLRPEGAWVGHVGDSRAYRVRGGSVQQLTFDHSWVWEIARRQGVDPEELGDFKRNVIIRSLGPEAEVEVDVEGPHPVEPGDAFLLCSDGLTNHVTAAEIGAVVSALSPAEACSFLIELANLRGGSDNVTCVVVAVPGREEPPTPLAGTRRPVGGGPFGRFPRSGWWFAVLAVGGLLVVLSVWMRFAAMPGYEWAFGVAAVLTLFGLGGLAWRLRRKVSEETAAHPALPGDLHVYKEHPFAVDEAACGRLAEQQRQTAAVLDAAGVVADDPAYLAAAAAAGAAATKGDWLTSFRQRCTALLALAAVTAKLHRRDEAFKPNWTTPHRPVG